jgi:hypothetical protein
MPRGDRTGPRGAGPMTGRAAGYCAGYPAPGYMNPMPGRGFGSGRGGGGYGWRHWFYATGLPRWTRFGQDPAWGYGQSAPPTPEQEAEGLKAQSEWLKEELDGISRRIEELAKER